MNKLRPFLVLLLVGVFFLNSSGCSSHDFSFKNLAKSDLDEVADHHYKEIEALLKDHTLKLYKRNPKYLKNLSGYANPTDSLDYRLKQIFDRPKKTKIPEGAHLVENDKASLPNPKLGHVSSSCWSVEYNNPFSIGVLKDGKNKIGQQLFAVYPLKNISIPVEIVSSHYVDPKGERVRV